MKVHEKRILPSIGLLLLLAGTTAGTLFSAPASETRVYLPLVSASDASFEMTWATVQRVIDGDTVVLQDGARVRYIGIDTPEMRSPAECYAAEATARNRELVEGRPVGLRKDVSETDRYGRLLRYLYLPGGEMVNAILVREGYATALRYPPDVLFADRFEALEQEARAAGRGMWGPACQGAQP